VRLATFNIMNGRSILDGRVDPTRLRTAVASLRVDVLALQEVDRGQARSGNTDLAAVAAGALGDEVTHRFAPAVVGVPGEAFRAATVADLDTAEAHYGVALATRWPVRSWWLTWLPHTPVPAPVFVPGPRGGRVVLLKDEPRVVLAAIIEAPIGPITVATTHLSFVPGWNIRQLRQTQRALRQLPAPRFLLGDLNLPGWLLRTVSGWRMLASRPTYPITRPRVQFDHLLLDPQGAAAVPPPRRGETPALDISDHRPLIVELSE
jgi:endonuclease/exonuclease/phosphatase family metal-dependent hydrolase